MIKNERFVPLQPMREKPFLLEKLDLKFRWGNYGFRVLRFHLNSFAPGAKIGFHKHSEFEFHFVASGKGSVVLDDQTYFLQEGMFYLTGPDVLHAQEMDQYDPLEELCLHLEIVPLTTDSFIERMDNDKSIASVEPADWGKEQEVSEAEQCVRQLYDLPARPMMDRRQTMSYFYRAYDAIVNHESGVYETIRQCIIQIMLLTTHASNQEKQPWLTLPHREASEVHFQMACQFIRDNYMFPIALEEVATTVGISKRQLQRVFQKYTSATFTAYLEEVRLTHICTELRIGNKTVEHIALDNGFENVNYLYLVFKKRYGMTPRSFKEQSQQIINE
ncbi:AraC family transcriptional regulator [Paenibacillus sp. PK4536]|uniref:HTH-type transcriptional activator RhaR n=1 Tax=Paenibacillus nuruki TaxID=1886670 RepID=A0A1E3L2B7_9BACL|nr:MULTISPECIES: AraC family transcriptional regulator [Paenibacillus]ODP27952.1 HTH-type transcriptional activator RhaR [Paenibacillus nuruki]TKJ89757.1 AraC family transcriptional regulator [Paenibacillus sp. CFBP13512]WIM40088.1 AraC family transcriptional regulator [Paenibacillus sp. PK4536]CAJ1317568.1 HTH-type transcriptional activator RhaR [Paenibacillus nuruki]